MCNEVAEASIQQFSFYELLTWERRGLNITSSRNNSCISRSHSPSSISELHTQSRWSELRLRPKRKSAAPLSQFIKCFVTWSHFWNYDGKFEVLCWFICFKFVFWRWRTVWNKSCKLQCELKYFWSFKWIVNGCSSSFISFIHLCLSEDYFARASVISLCRCCTWRRSNVKSVNNPANIPLNHQSCSTERSASIPAAAVLSDECSFSKCSFLCVSSRLGDSDQTVGWCKSWRELWIPRNFKLDWLHRGFDLQPSNMFSFSHPSKIHFAAFVLFHCHVDL